MDVKISDQAKEMAELYEPEWLAQMYVDAMDELVKHIPDGHTFPLMGNIVRWEVDRPEESDNGGTIIDPDKIAHFGGQYVEGE